MEAYHMTSYPNTRTCASWMGLMSCMMELAFIVWVMFCTHIQCLPSTAYWYSQTH
jgi:hypothetical protein